MYMNNAVLTVDGGRLMVSDEALWALAREANGLCKQVAGANDGIRMPEETFP